jgi:aspartate ammonia-lyase
MLLRSAADGSFWALRFFALLVLHMASFRARCKALLEHSLVAVTAINPFVGYAKASAVAKEALASGNSVRAVVLAKGLMTNAQLDVAFSTENLLGRTPT